MAEVGYTLYVSSRNPKKLSDWDRDHNTGYLFFYHAYLGNVTELEAQEKSKVIMESMKSYGETAGVEFNFDLVHWPAQTGRYVPL